MLPLRNSFVCPCRPPPACTLLCSLCGLRQHTHSRPGFCGIRPTNHRQGQRSKLKAQEKKAGRCVFPPRQGTWVLNFFLATALSHHREASGHCGHCSFPCLSSIVLMPVITAITLNIASSPNPASVLGNSPLVKPSSGSCRTLNGAHLKPHTDMKTGQNQNMQQ